MGYRAMSSRTRHRALAFLLASLVLTVLIALGLPQLTFKPGLPLPAFVNGLVTTPPGDPAPAGMGMSGFAVTLVLIVLGITLLAVVVRALSGVHLKRLLAGMWSVLWKLLLGCAAVTLVVLLLPSSPGSVSGPPMPEPRPLATAPLGPVPPALIWAAGILFGGAVLAVTARMILGRRRSAAPWEQEVDLARRALLAGGDLRDVILRCYARMAEALQEERGIEREASMTTGEFRKLLAEKGLPTDPVAELTRLFEAARYSPWEPTPADEKGALRSLDAILEHCRQGPLR